MEGTVSALGKFRPFRPPLTHVAVRPQKADKDDHDELILRFSVECHHGKSPIVTLLDVSDRN